MADLNERKTGVWGIERGDRANAEFQTVPNDYPELLKLDSV